MQGTSGMVVRTGNPTEDSEKRQAILEQAIRTFAECGFQGTDVQVIANGAGVGKGTIYRYFHNKEELFWAASFEVMLRLERYLAAAADRAVGVCDIIRNSAIAYAEFFSANPQYLEVFVQGRAEFRCTGPEPHREYHRQLVRNFENILQRGIDSGELRPLDTTRTTHMFGSLLYGIVVLACHLTSIPAVQMAEHSVDIFLRGIRRNALPVAETSSTISTIGSP